MDQVQQLRNLKDFLLVYNRMTEICFQRCTTNFNYRALTMDEERCVDSCAGKLIRSNHRLMGTYVQLMPGMVQRRMDELESKAAELAQAEAQAAGASAGVEQAAVPAVPGLAATDVPVGITPDMAAPIITTDAPLPPVFVPEAAAAVPDLSGIASPAADMPVMNGPSLTNGAGNGAPAFVPSPTLAPELSGPVGLVPGISEAPVVSSEAKAAVPITVEGPMTPFSIPSVTEISVQGSPLSVSGEKMTPSLLKLPSTVTPALPVTAPIPPEFSSSAPGLMNASSDAIAPLPVPVPKPADLTNTTSTPSTIGTAADSQSSS
ncbi:mitochondrial import inner membrane translocase subunit Tim10 B [Alosa pseudoharengus]|uniref:mitochondrial import inner membrane translocase subunit Tim10 B n=1 Tax=Alosa pseudoharengus TaxID=34774 RepID=UPI003F89F03F